MVGWVVVGMLVGWVVVGDFVAFNILFDELFQVAVEVVIFMRFSLFADMDVQNMLLESDHDHLRKLILQFIATRRVS